MAVDVRTSATAFVDAAGLLERADGRLVADWACPDAGPRPTRRAVLDPLTPAGAAVAQCLMDATGELLAAVQAGGRYTPDDVAALTGAAAAHRDRVVSGLALWMLAWRKNPADADKVPLAKAAIEAKDRLAAGEDVFGLGPAIDAGGGPTVAPLTAPPNTTGKTVRAAARFFGNRNGVC